jgi:hypothetical protein
MRLKTLLAALALVLSAPTARGQGKADSPSTILNQSTPDFARCVEARGLVKMVLTLDLDRESRVEKVDIDTEADLSKGSRRCIEKVATRLHFGPDLAGMTIEHELQVVSSARGKKK